MEEKTSSNEQVFIRWKAPAYRYAEKNMAWYATMALIVLVFVAWGVLSEAYVVSVTFLILAGVYYLLQKERPPMLLVEITDIGIRFGQKLYKYSEIRAFWIYYEPPELHALNFEVQKNIDSHITIDFPPELSVAKLRDFLISQLPERADRLESFSESLIRHLGL